MSRFSKVSWQDGMFLLPQHFQQADRHHQAALSLLHRALSPLCYGVQRLQFDEDALQRGTLGLVRCQALFQGGMAVDAPALDALPGARPFQLDPGRRSLEVFLAVPALREGQPLCTRDSARADIRYVQELADIADDQDPDQRQPIEIARKNLRLLLSGEAQDGLEVLKLGEVQRSADGALLLRPEFIPPCTHAGAAPALQVLLRELLATVLARASSLASKRRASGFSGQPSSDDVEEMLFLQALNTSSPVLRHLCEQRDAHPAEIYAELLRLCGALSTFDPLKREAADLPAYDHKDLSGCFGRLDKALRQLLDRRFSQPYVVIPLTRAELFWKGLIADQDVRARGELFLAATGLPPAVAQGFPNSCKIAEYEQIDRVMGTFVTEVKISPVQTLPDGVPRRPEAAYFRVDRQSKGFDAILKTGQIAVFVAGAKNLPELRLELVGLRPRSAP